MSADPQAPPSVTTDPDPAAGLASELDALVIRARAAHQAEVRAARWSEAWRLVPWLLFVVPGTVLFIQMVGAVHGGPAWDVSWWVLVLGALLVPALWLLGHAWTEPEVELPRQTALGRFDQGTDAHDRLLAADEFRHLAGDARTPFHLASLEDAHAAVGAAQAVRFATPEVTHPEPATFARIGGAAALAVLLAILWGEPVHHGAAAGDGVIVADGGGALETAETPRPPDRTDPDEDPKPEAPPPTPEGKDAGGADVERPMTELSQDSRKSEGKTQSGQSAAAESASGSNDARGAPSNQGPSNKESPKRNKPTSAKPTKPKPPKEDEGEPKREALQDSGATAGRGATSGSNRNPVASDWSSKDQVAPDEEDELDDDEDVDDEESESEARGGMQPNLRDRRPPVSRDLTIGFGNQPSQDANGRGGPSEGKKSRGVASLVLGVPIPDRIKGQPNPGKTKVTQERVEPKAEPSDPVAAGPRSPRTSPVGHRPSPDLDPWWRAFLRDYFLTLREEATPAR